MPQIKPHLLVVDDDDRLRRLLHKYLGDNGFCVSMAEDAAQARNLLGYFAFDAVILDVMMPDESGLEFLHKLRLDSNLPVLMLSALGEADNRIEGLSIGADDYLAKPFEPKELLLRIERLLARSGRIRTTPANIRFGSFVFNHASHSLTNNGQPVHLTSAEAALLALLADNAGKAVSREALAEKLPGGEMNVRSVDVQMTRLRKKIEQNPKQPVYLRTARGEGYMLSANI